MPFDYYERLKPWQRSVYDQSDRITEIPIPGAARASDTIIGIRDALKNENRRTTEARTRDLTGFVCSSLNCRRPDLKVLSVRPSDDYEELHGLYEYGDEGDEDGESEPPLITVWMRTAQNRRVVAVRSYLRTVLHELCHHLDYEHYRLRDSFHTDGFYKRESSLFKQLTKSVELPRAGGARKSGKKPAASATKSAGDATPAAPVYIEDNRDWS